MQHDPFSNPQGLVRLTYSYVAYRIGAGPDAEDITSEAFERALRYRESFDPKRGDPAAWLIGIARRCIADQQRRSELPAEEIPEGSSAGHAETSVHRLDLAAALARLDERDRDLLALRYGSDLSARQIGEILDMKTNAVEVALHRALKTLRALLQDDGSPLATTNERWPVQQQT